MPEITKTSLSAAAVQAAATLFQGTGDVDGFKNAAGAITAKLVEAFDNDPQAQKRANATGGGGYRKGGGSGGGLKDADPATLPFKGTKFAGKTIDQVYKMSPTEAFNNHQYADQQGNPQAGKAFVEWLSTKDGFMAGKCKQYIENLSKPAAAEAPPTETAVSSETAPAATTTETTTEEFSFGGGGW